MASSVQLGGLPSSSLLGSIPLVSSPVPSLGLSWMQGSLVTSPMIANTDLPIWLMVLQQQCRHNHYWGVLPIS